MRYAPPGLCLNDFNLMHEADGYHLLHLQGPWTERFDEKAMETSYGHARSRDLVNWEPLGPVFGVGDPGRFDASAVWTMHTFEHADGLGMAYTGVRAGRVTEQAVGLALSDRRDGTGWLRMSPDAVVEADPRWYVTDVGMAWRDPFVVHAESSWVMAICATATAAPAGTGGCVALATSDDLTGWRVQPPTLLPGTVHELECPVLEPVDGGWLLLGSIGPQHRIDAWFAQSVFGPWTALGPIGPAGPYAPRLIDGPDGARLLLHTVQRRVGLRDSGAPCRGFLAQPKVFDTSDPVRPVLRWWPGNEPHFAATTDEPETDGLLELDGDGPAVLLRGTPDRPALVLDRSGGRVRLRDHRDDTNDDGGTELLRGRAGVPPHRLRVLLIGEFIEIYGDDELLESIVDYRTRSAPMLLDGGSVRPAPIRPLRLSGPPRDDVSALPRHRLRVPAAPLDGVVAPASPRPGGLGVSEVWQP